MSGLVAVLQGVVLVFEAALAVLVGYLLLLAVAAVVGASRRGTAKRVVPLPAVPTRFAVLVPAHNEEKLLPDLLASLRVLEYPRQSYRVHVVADNCTDSTAEVARQGGAVVHERTNLEQRGKGYALQWLLGEIKRDLPETSLTGLTTSAFAAREGALNPYDAFVILDADSLVSPNFLQVMHSHLARGERAIQAYYAVRDPDRSWNVALRYAALAGLHYLRPLARMVLGASVGLKGNGMAFAAELAERYPWSASLTEDIEYHMALVLGGERVTFAPDAVVWAEMPGTLADAQSQNVRWERGRLEMVRGYVPRLLAAAWAALGAGDGRRAYLLFDAAMEQIIPPFSILAGASILGLLAAVVLGSAAGVVLGLGLLLGQVAYTFAGLWLAVAAPRRVYLALLGAPALVAWKIWLYARVLLGLDRQGWVRTKRNTRGSG